MNVHESRGPTGPSDPPGPVPPVLRITGLAKAFGPTKALRDCSLELLPGEVHAIVGENGSGKSTFVKILSGVHRPDTGTIEIGGTSRRGLRSPRDAHAAGIATVFQEVLVVDAQSVLANVWLGTSGVFRERVALGTRRERATEVLTELLGHPLDLDAPVESLPLSDRQACGIARALVRDPKVLILDEATSALDIATRDRLFGVLRRLRAAGTSTLFISHRMDEIDEICDRITVLRSGESVGTVTEASTQELVRLMTGAEHLVTGAHRPAREPGAVLLRTRGVRLGPDRAPIDVEIRAGELVGLAGLEGHGQDAFLRALWGGPVAAGEVHITTEPTSTADPTSTAADLVITSPAQAAAHGIAYVPRDRRGEAIFPALSIAENFAAATQRADRRGGLLSTRRSRERLAGYVDRLRIKLGRPAEHITTLSGGNQQKVVLARWLATDPRVLLLNDPTRGVDLGAKRDIYALLTELASAGVAVVMLSTELDEHVELMDRVLVFREGVLGAEIGRDRLTRAALVSAFFGRGDHD